MPSIHSPVSRSYCQYSSFVLEFHEPADRLQYDRLRKLKLEKDRQLGSGTQSTGEDMCTHTLNLMDPVTMNVSDTSSHYCELFQNASVAYFPALFTHMVT